MRTTHLQIDLYLDPDLQPQLAVFFGAMWQSFEAEDGSLDVGGSPKGEQYRIRVCADEIRGNKGDAKLCVDDDGVPTPAQVDIHTDTNFALEVDKDWLPAGRLVAKLTPGVDGQELARLVMRSITSRLLVTDPRQYAIDLLGAAGFDPVARHLEFQAITALFSDIQAGWKTNLASDICSRRGEQAAAIASAAEAAHASGPQRQAADPDVRVELDF